MPPEQRERAILEAAVDLARQGGIAGLTVRTVAAAAGVTPALVVTLVWVQAWAAGARNEELAARVRLEMDLWQQDLERIVADGVSAGEISPERAEGAAWLLLATVDGMNAHSLVKWAPEDRAALARRTVAALLG
jgi:AcrR family transcriptional regulator